MLVKRKLYSVMDEEGNLGYYLYDESTGDEKMFSVVEDEERLYANVRNVKHAMNMILDKSFKGKLTTKDIARYRGIKGGKPSAKLITNPNFEKVAKAGYNKFDKMTRGEFGKTISKPDFVNQLKDNVLSNIKDGPSKLSKGEVKSAVNFLNTFKYIPRK